MLPTQVTDALSEIAASLSAHPELEGCARRFWRAAGQANAAARAEAEVPADLQAALTLVERELPPLTRSPEDVAEIAALFAEPAGLALLSWCSASSFRRDAQLAPLLRVAAMHRRLQPLVAAAARDRVIEGPLLDAIVCAPLIGDGAALSLPENEEACARLEILVWEAGASALEVPELGAWIWGSPSIFEAVISGPAHGPLRGRVIAARFLEISVCGLSPSADPELIGQTLRVLQPLILHPEPLVWIHAARALGRLTGSLEQMEGTLLDWVLGESRVLRQRATTALASLPAARFALVAGQLISIIKSPGEEALVLASVAAATPYLFFERRDIWDRLAARVLGGDGGAIAARALARGLAAIWRRGTQRDEIEAPLRALREMARSARPRSIDDARRWIEVTAVTDVVEGAERDPLDLELGLENLMRIAAQYDDEEADARAARFAGALATTFQEARRIALGSGRLRQRAAAINAVEGCARAFALRVWGPLLATRAEHEAAEEPDLEETWKLVASAPAEILDLIDERRDGEARDAEDELALEVLAIRLGGYALDACGEDSDLGPGRGPTAHDTCLWLRKLKGLVDGSRELPAPLAGALSALFWRLVDTTRGTALGEVDDVRWLGPFAAWWGLVIDRPLVLLQLATALPMMAPDALARCCEQAEALRMAVCTGVADGGWGPTAATALSELHADDTELALALTGMATVLASFAVAAGPRPELDPLCIALVLAATRLHRALSDPVKALHPGSGEMSAESVSRATADNAHRVAALIAGAIRKREISTLDVWFASLGPVTSALLEEAVRAAIRRTPPPPPKPKKPEPKIIEGYELVKPLGEGGIGSVWLVRKPGADRLFVLKIPKTEALASATDQEREGILGSFIEEAKALAGLYHPNVANIIDRGVSDAMPFLVLEYLIGADLKQYSAARPMTLFELRQVVVESCAGLAALHGAGLVHRDIKPANLWLRLPLAGGERFDPEKHRDPARAQPLAAVVIDFGMVRAIRVPPESGGRFVAGTPGYIAPEQVLDPVELDPRSDIYAFAATIYNVTTGRTFFDDVTNPRDRIIAHLRRDPFEDRERLSEFPASMAKLLRAATAHRAADRPSPLEFSREFIAAL